MYALGITAEGQHHLLETKSRSLLEGSQTQHSPTSLPTGTKAQAEMSPAPGDAGLYRP